MDFFMGLLLERVALDNVLRKAGALIGCGALAGRWARFVRSLAGRPMGRSTLRRAHHGRLLRQIAL